MALLCIIIQRLKFLSLIYSAAILPSLIIPEFTASARCAPLQQRSVKAGSTPANTILEMPADTFHLDFNKDIVDQLMPFDSLYELALKHSPAIRYERENGEVEKANYSLSKIVVFKNVYPFVNYANGTQSLASNGTLVSDLNQITNGYRYGVNVQLPLDEVFGRRAKIRQAAASYRAMVAKRQVEELSLKRDLIRVYQDMLTAQRILKVRYKDEQTSGMALQVAEVELKQGKIEPRDLAQVSTFYAQAKSATEYQLGEFLKHFYDLQALVGVPIQYLQPTARALVPQPDPKAPAPRSKR